jgi:hypothetical protein
VARSDAESIIRELNDGNSDSTFETFASGDYVQMLAEQPLRVSGYESIPYFFKGSTPKLPAFPIIVDETSHAEDVLPSLM